MKKNDYLYITILFFFSISFLSISCTKSSDDEDYQDTIKEKVSIYKQKIVGEWVLIGTMYKSGKEYREPIAVTCPNFKPDGTLVYTNNPSSRHQYKINDKGQLEMDHLDGTLEELKHELLAIEFQENYTILILGPDILGNRDKYKRKE